MGRLNPVFPLVQPGASLCTGLAPASTEPCTCSHHQLLPPTAPSALGLVAWSGNLPQHIMGVSTEGPLTLEGVSCPCWIAVPWSYLSVPSYTWRCSCGILGHDSFILCLSFLIWWLQQNTLFVCLFSLENAAIIFHNYSSCQFGPLSMGPFCVKLVLLVTAPGLVLCCFE